MNNQNGLPVMLSVCTRKHRHGHKHEVYGSCKRYDGDASCTCDCLFLDACKCNWVECFCVTGSVDESLCDVLQHAAGECGKLERCHTCSAVVFDEPELRGLCGSCFMQNIVDAKLCKRPCGGDCPICLSSTFKSDSIELPCHHHIHVHCSRGLLHYTCPLCRAPFDEELILDHLPPRV